MWLVLGLLQLVAFRDTVQWSEKFKMSKHECDSYIKQSDAQTATILECLITHYNLTQLLGQVHDKMDQIEQKLKEVFKKNQEYESKNPFKNIDDVLDIKDGDKIADQDCQRQQLIVQAIRRKLEWHNLINGIDSTHFEWPGTNSGPSERSRTLDTDDSDDSEELQPELLKLRTKKSAVVDGFRCIVRNSLQNSDAVRRANLLLQKYRKAKTTDEGNIKRQRSRYRGL